MLRSEAVTEKSPLKEAIKVLIADDDAPTRSLLRTAIAQWGYKAIEARDGEEAWNLLKNENGPKLLIVDWLMPKMDGIQLCKQIRHQLIHHPYIILLTQNTGTANIVVGLEAGADEFLTKPFKMAELRSRLSIGARIIEYQNIFVEKSDKINGYIQVNHKIQKLTEQSLDELEKISQSMIQQNPKIVDSLQLIKNALTEIQQIQLKEKLHKTYSENVFKPMEVIPNKLDLPRIHEIFGDDKENIANFFKVFIESTDDLVENITTALNEKNAEEAKALLHHLKGSSGNSGVTILYQLSMKAEEELNLFNWEIANKLILEIKNELAMLKEYFLEKI